MEPDALVRELCRRRPLGENEVRRPVTLQMWRFEGGSVVLSAHENKVRSSGKRRDHMRTSLLFGIVCALSACGGTSSDGDADAAGDAGADDVADVEPDVIRTGEVCNVSADCKMNPGRDECREPKTAVRYEPTCGADQRCTWDRIEDRCDFECHDGYCITVAH